MGLCMCLNMGRLVLTSLWASAEAFIQEPGSPVWPLSGYQCHFATTHHPLPSWWPRKPSDSRGEPSGLVRRLEGGSGWFDAGLSKKYITAVVKKKQQIWLVVAWINVGWKVLETFKACVEFNELLPLKPIKDLLHHCRETRQRWWNVSSAPKHTFDSSLVIEIIVFILFIRIFKVTWSKTRGNKKEE